jgi:hypothetical protein
MYNPQIFICYFFNKKRIRHGLLHSLVITVYIIWFHIHCSVQNVFFLFGVSNSTFLFKKKLRTRIDGQTGRSDPIRHDPVLGTICQARLTIRAVPYGPTCRGSDPGTARQPVSRVGPTRWYVGPSKYIV